MDKKIIADLKARRLSLGLSISDLAERVHKDESTVKKQLSEKTVTGLQLSTVLEYANALEGTLQFITYEEQVQKPTMEIDLLNHRLAEQAKHIEYLQDKLDGKDETIHELRYMNNSLQEQLIRSANDIARKDKKLAELIDSVVDLTKKVTDKI